MAEITDALQVDSRISNAGIERLDRGGYLQRRSLTGANFYAFDITPKGLAALPQLAPDLDALAKDGLKPMYVKLLRFVSEAPEKLPDFVRQENLASLEVASAISHLVRLGYLREGGLWRRNLYITDQGRAVLARHGG